VGAGGRSRSRCRSSTARTGTSRSGEDRFCAVAASIHTIEGLAARGRVEELAREVTELRRASGEAYADVREAIADLRTRPEPGPVGLRQALAEYVSQFGDRAGLVATFDAEAPTGSPAELQPAAEVQLLRIVQEALANVRKHARASRVAVRFWFESSAWHVSIEDDGVGFDSSAASSPQRGSQLGLQIMRERAESLGGQVEVSSRPGQGTRVHAQVPSGAQSTRRASTTTLTAEAAPRGTAAAAAR